SYEELAAAAPERQHKEAGGDMRIHPAGDTVTICAAARMFIDRQLAYCSHLKKWIKRETDKNVLAGIAYGDDLPEDLDVGMDAVLASSTAQLEKIVAAVKDRKSTRLNSSHVSISYAVFCLKKKKQKHILVR